MGVTLCSTCSSSCEIKLRISIGIPFSFSSNRSSRALSKENRVVTSKEVRGEAVGVIGAALDNPSSNVLMSGVSVGGS